MAEAVEKRTPSGSVQSSSDGDGGNFIQETREELNRVSFPSWEDVQGTTLIVIVNVIFFAIFLFVVDQFWVQLLRGLEWLVGRTGLI